MHLLVKCQQDESPRGVEVSVCEQGYEPVAQPAVGIRDTRVVSIAFNARR